MQGDVDALIQSARRRQAESFLHQNHEVLRLKIQAHFFGADASDAEQLTDQRRNSLQSSINIDARTRLCVSIWCGHQQVELRAQSGNGSE